MAKNLVIVESPAKAKTIEKFLGKDYKVTSSFGHIRDLPGKKMGIKIEEGFSPEYEISDDKKKLVKDLKKLADKAEVIWLATDEDREGEAISWHLIEALELPKEKIKRIVFHEITKSAITNAVQNPRDLDVNLVNAQQARRVLDRLVGFEISPVLWRKVKPRLSAGRVQSVAVRLIVEKEEEINNFKAESFFKAKAEFILVKDGKTLLEAELPKKIKTKEAAEKFLAECIGSKYTVEAVEKKPGKRSPAPPFTTSTLQQEAGRKLGFSVAKTMLIAQQLYESGKITYMRTDSLNLSSLAINTAKQLIVDTYGKEYSKPRQFKTKSKSAQEAHEAIRPTYIANSEIEGTSDQVRLYDLIRKRTLASQMADATLERTSIKIDISKSKEKFVAKGEVIIFEGFLKVYIESTDDEDTNEEQKGLLPPLSKGDELKRKRIQAIQKFTKHSPRYSEASLVKKMEELGIGRPSTYAPTISTIQKREYVIKKDIPAKNREFITLNLTDGQIEEITQKEKYGYEKAKLVPTDIGVVVNAFLVQNFKDILDYNFTANVEKEFDEIAEGKKVWNDTISRFYAPFHKEVENTLEHSEKATGQRILGIDPKSGRNIYARIGRFGPMIQIGEAEDEEKPIFASLLKGQSISSITMEEALDLFKLPRTVGKYEEEEVIAAVGRFGPYVKHKNKFYSLPKNINPMKVTIDQAIEIIKEKIQKDKEKFIKEFEKEKIQILNGRYGAYIKKGRKNYRIPKDKEPKDLTLEEVLNIIEAADKNPKTKTRSKRTKKK
jgi:DNA topoisomerase-1